MNSKTYAELNALPPEAFLDPNNFKTGYDTLPPREYAQQQYEKGLKISNESTEVGISANGTWYACGIDGSYTSSYEGCGYHACTADLLRGFLSGTAKFVVYRYVNGNVTSTTIKEHTTTK